MGKEKILKHISQSAKNLPVVIDKEGNKVNHERIMKKLFLQTGNTAEVNRYIKQCIYVNKLVEIKNSPNDSR
jgi:hypothetical protein